MTKKGNHIAITVASAVLFVILIIVFRFSMNVDFDGERSYVVSFNDSMSSIKNEQSFGIEIDSSQRIGPTFEMEVSLFTAEPEFIYGHKDSITFPLKFAYSSENKVEDVEKFRTNKHPIDRIFYYSDQHDVYDLNIYSVYVSHEHCWEEISLVILNAEDSLLNLYYLAKNAGCGTDDEHKTVFTSDSSFTTIYYPNLGFEYLDLEKQLGLKYAKITKNYLIKPSGKIQEIGSRTDSLIAPRKY